MSDYKSQTVPKDIARRRILNEELNPRVTIMGEATQSINPITGQEYNAGMPDYKIIDQVVLSPTLRGAVGYNMSEFMKYQISLACMDLSDKKMSYDSYSTVSEHIRQLIMQMNKAKISINSISSPESLDDALRQLETESFREKKIA